MSTPQVFNYTSTLINRLNIEENDKNKVKKCVSGYSMPDSFLGKISWVAYRIFNAFKSIFGQSDWQIAKKIIINKLKLLTEKTLLEDCAETCLKDMVKSGESKVEVQEKIDKLLQPMNDGRSMEIKSQPASFIHGSTGEDNGSKGVKEAQIKRLDEWLTHEKIEFVCHGIFDTNIVKNVLKDGFLRSGEEILRNKSSLEFEGGSSRGARETVSLPRINDKYRQTFADVVKIFEFNINEITKFIKSYNSQLKTLEKYKIWRINLSIVEKTEIKSDDEGKKNRRIKAAKKAEELVNNYFSDAYYKTYYKLKNLFESEKEKLWQGEKTLTRDFYQVPLLAIAVDKSLPKEKRCHRQLAKIYEIYLGLKNDNQINISKREMRHLMFHMRRVRLLDPYKITSKIWAYKNDITNCYGFVYVLKKNIEHIVGGEIEESHKTTEYFLLEPYQNKGEFFHVDLSDPNTLIIGSKKFLGGLIDDERLKNNLVFAENIPDEQWEKLGGKPYLGSCLTKHTPIYSS